MITSPVRLEQYEKVEAMLVTLMAFDMSGGEVSWEQLVKVLRMLVTLMAFDMSGGEVILEQPMKVAYMLVTLGGIMGAEISLEQ